MQKKIVLAIDIIVSNIVNLLKTKQVATQDLLTRTYSLAPSKVYPASLEKRVEAVLSQHPEVAQAVVVARAERSGSKALCAYVVGRKSSLEVGELRSYLSGKLPAYMVPTSFVKLESFPLTSSGKVDRRALPAPDLSTVSREYVAPRNELEEQLAEIWQEVLGVQPIGVTDDFFALGGHSLLAVRIFLEIERGFGKKLPLATLFQTPTIEKLAAALREQGWKPTWSPLVAIQPRGLRPPFFAVHGGYGEVMFYSELARCLGEDQPFYGLQAEGLDGKPIRHTSMEAIACYYIQEIRRPGARSLFFGRLLYRGRCRIGDGAAIPRSR